MIVKFARALVAPRRLAKALAMALALCPAGGRADTNDFTVLLRGSTAADAPVIDRVALYGASHALVIGNDGYVSGWPRLANAVADAEAVAAGLEAQGFDVTLATDLDGSAMRQALQDFFVVKGADPEARLFVWFAGHGWSDDGEGYIVPTDAPLPSADRVGFKLAGLPMRQFEVYARLADSKHVFVVFDSCFSGTIFDTGRDVPSLAITRATTLPVRQFLTAGDAGQSVLDDGTFRKLFLRALSGQEPADLNADGYITATELGVFLSGRMTNLTVGLQTPKHGKLRDPDWDRGEFVFAALGDAAAPADPSPLTQLPAAVAMDVAFWDSIRGSRDMADYRAYLSRFPAGMFADLALEVVETGQQMNEPISSLSDERIQMLLARLQEAGSPTSEYDGAWRGDGDLVCTGNIVHHPATDLDIEMVLVSNSVSATIRMRKESRPILLEFEEIDLIGGETWNAIGYFLPDSPMPREARLNFMGDFKAGSGLVTIVVPLFRCNGHFDLVRSD
jgi:hypothetical protein